MVSAEELARRISQVLQAHSLFPRRPEMAFRKIDGKTPYGVHPIWCAMSILAEPLLPEDVRIHGASILLFHDVLEDTFASLPDDLSAEEVQGVVHMTFENVEQELEYVWSRGPFILLLKCYDKTHSLLDASRFTPEKRRRNAAYALRLAERVEAVYGTLAITVMCRALCEHLCR